MTNKKRMSKEIWRDIRGYEGLYQVSNLGRVKSLRSNNILKGGSYPNGYLFVGLCKHNKVKTCMRHRLVAQAFIPNLLNKPEVDHINTDKNDNTVENLRWVTHYENDHNPLTVKHRMKAHVGLKERVGKKHTQSKEVLQLALDGKVVRDWESIGEVERHLGFGHSNIISCLKGRQKTSYGYKWEYKN